MLASVSTKSSTISFYCMRYEGVFESVESEEEETTKKENEKTSEETEEDLVNINKTLIH